MNMNSPEGAKPDDIKTEPLQTERHRYRAKKYSLAWWLDSSIPLPGGYRIGLDGIIGLIPGVGDIVGGGLSSWILYQGYQQGVPKFILARMLINVFVDAVVGAIPIAGDLFDFFWKANQRNAALLEAYKQNPTETYRRAAGSSIIFFVGLVVIITAVIYLMILLMRVVWQSISGG